MSQPPISYKSPPLLLNHPHLGTLSRFGRLKRRRVTSCGLVMVNLVDR
jgi:hypothetical protein